MSDKYADYWEQNLNHSLANYLHCVVEADKSFQYGPSCWGLTASPGPDGYKAFAPHNDNGTIAPAAAVGSMPYTSELSLRAARKFTTLQDGKVFDKHGFVAAFNLKEGWRSKHSVALDQGANILMIENYRTGLPWSLLRKNKDVQTGLKKLGFEYK